MIYRGYNGSVAVEGDWLVITREGMAARATIGKVPARRLPLQTLHGVRFKPATRLVNGSLQLLLGGVDKPEPTATTAAGDPDVILFTHSQRDQFGELHRWLLTVVHRNAADGVDPAAHKYDPAVGRNQRMTEGLAGAGSVQINRSERREPASWFARHKTLSGVGGFMALVFVVGQVSGDPEPPRTPIASTPTASAPTTAVSESTTPTPVATTTAPLAQTRTTPPPTPSRTAPATEEPIGQAEGGGGTALALLGVLAVKGRAGSGGYDRALFGQPWADTDRNGCDTRNDVLARDLVGETLEPGTRDCVVLSGTLTDPYTGRTITFTKQDGNAVQIDHVVALSDAWQKGAQQWEPGKRLAFANDPLNLVAVDGPTNGSKSDSDAASWLPPKRGSRCAMVARQTAVKAKYRLWVTAAERDAIARVLGACPNQKAPEGSAPTEAAVAAPQRTTTPATGGGTSYPNCAAVRAAGKAPIRRGQPGYSTRLDRDGDGVACDTTTSSTSRPPRPSSPATTSSPPSKEVASYANCAAVRAAGKAPIRRGQPGYSTRLDKDRDGVACDT